MSVEHRTRPSMVQLYGHPNLPGHWVLESEDGRLWTVDPAGGRRQPFPGSREQLEGAPLSAEILRLVIIPQLVNATEIARRVGSRSGAVLITRWQQRYDDFPKPLVAGDQSRSPLWYWPDVLAWYQGRWPARAQTLAAKEATMARAISSSLSFPLPVDTRDNSDADFEALGFQFGDPLPHRPRFRAATLPEGWSIAGGGPSVTELVDERGLVRVDVVVIERSGGDVTACMYAVNMPDRLARAAVLDGHPIPWEVLTGPERLEVRRALAEFAKPPRPGCAQETADRSAELLAAAPTIEDTVERSSVTAGEEALPHVQEEGGN